MDFSKIKKWQIGAIFFCIIIGTLLHFAYEFSRRKYNYWIF